MTTAISAQLCLLVYHQATTWFDFFPFNGVRYTKPKERVIEALVNFALMSLAPIGFILESGALMKFGLVYYYVLFAIECVTWWVPYVFGASEQWQEIYTRVHARTITLLPSRSGKPRPNLEHMILMVLTIIAAVTTWRDFKSLRPGPPPSLWIGWMIGALLVAGTAWQMVYGKRAPVNTRPVK